MDILMGNVDPSEPYYCDIRAMGMLYSNSDPDCDFSAADVHIQNLGFEPAPPEGGDPFPAPCLAPARHVRHADRRLRRALDAYVTILRGSSITYAYVE